MYQFIFISTVWNSSHVISTKEYGLNVCFIVTTKTKAWAHEVKWSIKGEKTSELSCPNDIEFDNNNEYQQICCLPTLENKFTISCKDTYGDGWHMGYLEIEGNRYCDKFTHGHEVTDILPNPAKQFCGEGRNPLNRTG